jgi:hypothetical protein
MKSLRFYNRVWELLVDWGVLRPRPRRHRRHPAGYTRALLASRGRRRPGARFRRVSLARLLRA